MSEFIPISDPATMAQPYAESLMLGGHIDTMTHTEQEEQALKELTQIAFDSKMLFAKYIVKSHKSFITPATGQVQENVNVTHFDSGLTYSGKFVGFSTVRIGSIIGGNAIRALCLTFEETTLLPYFDELPSDKWLHTPAHAVKTMTQRAA